MATRTNEPLIVRDGGLTKEDARKAEERLQRGGVDVDWRRGRFLLPRRWASLRLRPGSACNQRCLYIRIRLHSEIMAHFFQRRRPNSLHLTKIREIEGLKIFVDCADGAPYGVRSLSRIHRALSECLASRDFPGLPPVPPYRAGYASSIPLTGKWTPGSLHNRLV